MAEFGSDVDIADLGIKACDLARKDFARWQPQKQKPVPLADHAVSKDGQDGTPEWTVLPKKAAYGT
ncbi:hypothetical protein AAII07_56415 [Microvirga sp. 0TCS3.31]